MRFSFHERLLDSARNDKHERTSIGGRLAFSHFQLSSQNPMEEGEQSKCRSNQNDRVEDEDTDLDPKMTFLCAEEDVRPVTPAIIALFHLGVRNQIGNLLFHINLLGCNRAGRVLEKGTVERPLSIQNLIDQAKVMIEVADGICLEARKQSERFLQLLQPLTFTRILSMFRDNPIDLTLRQILPPRERISLACATIISSYDQRMAMN